ncbi:hypothetical protein [Corynebacterium parakroppenstedtii]|uniref:hypothetical protein n=1 Tax=Corynebacterium parakroppenstedtii TaxID=2828363 RepID=UPI001C8F88C7|nr:hypothetical protein [Corynebacterium parakroppenstedtii]MBY0794750.1 hypothetical protein [Corynebacterium parakroppenstedtii]
MSEPIFKLQSDSELRQERTQLLAQMEQFGGLTALKRLRLADDLTYEEEALLDNYEMVDWVIGDNG